MQLEFDKTSATPLRDQICQQVHTKISAGELVPGERLPSLRELAKTSDVGICTWQRAFEKLAQDHVIVKRPKLGSFVSDSFPRLSAQKTPKSPDVKLQIHAAIIVRKEYLDHSLVRLVMQAFEIEISENGGRVSTVVADPKNWDKSLQQHKALLRQVDGILFTSHFTDNDAVLKQMMAFGKPIVSHNYQGQLEVPRINDDFNWAVREICRHLLICGHRHIAFCSYRSQDIKDAFWLVDREQAFLDFARMEKMPVSESDILQVNVATVGDPDMEIAGARKLAKMLACSKKQWTAAIAVNDHVGYGIYTELTKQGIKVPQDISLFGFDNQPMSQQIGLSTVIHACSENGQGAAKLLGQQIANPNQNQITEITNKPKLIFRDSVAVLQE